MHAKLLTFENRKKNTNLTKNEPSSLSCSFSSASMRVRGPQYQPCLKHKKLNTTKPYILVISITLQDA